ncbi:hypothetical protein [Rhizobium sp. 007]|nr:hypothetical protein [Rhizobium sp. 007]QPB18822.1 hypothetical protein ISN39_14400 [Rhizobium sp. 007]
MTDKKPPARLIWARSGRRHLAGLRGCIVERDIVRDVACRDGNRIELRPL